MKLNLYANLLRLLFDSEAELGITGLTECDRLVLQQVLETSKKLENDSTAFKIRYDEIVDKIAASGGAAMSKTQFFKSMKKFENMGLIRKVGSERSSDYLLVK